LREPPAACLGALYAFQLPFRRFPGVEYFTFDLTTEWQEKTELPSPV
jgi:hypothetical protein